MRCPKCQSVIADDIKYCNYCGTPQKQNIEPENYLNNNETFQYNQNYNTNNNDDDLYLKAYVGDKYDEFKETKFNIGMFFLTFWYILYRKQWLLAAIWFAIELVSLIIGTYGTLLLLFVRIFFAIKFNEWYLNNAKKETEKIINKNSDKSSQEIIEICKKKGKPTFIVPLVAALISFMLGVILGILLVYYGINEDFYNRNYDNRNNDSYKYNDKSDDKNENDYNSADISYKVPVGFEISLDEYDLKTYYYDDYDNKTNCSITYYLYENWDDVSKEDFLNEYTYPENKDNINISDITINNNVWSTYTELTSLGKTDHYAIQKFGNIYYFEYESTTNNNKCDQLREEFIKTITFDKQETKKGTDSL